VRHLSAMDRLSTSCFLPVRVSCSSSSSERFCLLACILFVAKLFVLFLRRDEADCLADSSTVPSSYSSIASRAGAIPPRVDGIPLS
jgi:hypothetical protein